MNRLDRTGTPFHAKLLLSPADRGGAAPSGEPRGVMATDRMEAANGATANRGPAAPKREFIVFAPKDGDHSAMMNVLTRGQSALQQSHSCTERGRFVVSLTDAEAAECQRLGMRVIEDFIYTLPEPIDVADGDRIPLTDDVSNATHGIRRLQQEPGWEGEGVLFITIDTGIGENESLKTPVLYDDMLTAQPNDPPSDSQGHGTFVSGIAVADGDPDQGGLRGAAPKASLAGINVFEPSGGARISTIIAALDRAIEWANSDEWKDNPVVVNLSLGGRAVGDRDESPVAELINEMVREHGIFVTVAAGNSGPGLGTVADPGVAEHALTVAATDHRGTADASDDRTASFSSRGDPSGPAGQNDKPDISAGGVDRLSTRSGGGFTRASGTSFAAPEAGGAGAALLGKAHALFQQGEFGMPARDLVRSLELNDIFISTAADISSEPAHADGAGDLRADAAGAEMLARHSTLQISDSADNFREIIEALRGDDGSLSARDQLDVLHALTTIALDIQSPEARIEFLSKAREIYSAAEADLAPHTVTRLSALATDLAAEAAFQVARAPGLSIAASSKGWDTLVAWRAGGQYGALQAENVFELSRFINAAVGNMNHQDAAEFLTAAKAHMDAAEFDGKEDLDQALRAQAYLAFEGIAAEPTETPDAAVQNLTRYAEWLGTDEELTNRSRTRMLATALTKCAAASPENIRLDALQAFRTWSHGIEGQQPQDFVRDAHGVVDRLTIEAIEARAERGFASANDAIALMQQVWDIHMEDGVRTDAEDGEFFSVLQRTIDRSADQFVQSPDHRTAFRAGVSQLLQTVKPLDEDTAAMASWLQLRSALFTRLSTAMLD